MDQRQTGKIVLSVAAAGLLVGTTPVPSYAATKTKSTVVTLKPSTTHTYVYGKAVTYKIRASGVTPKYRWYLLKLGKKTWKRVSTTSKYKFKATTSYHGALVKATAQVKGRKTTTISPVHVFVLKKGVKATTKKTSTTSTADTGSIITLGSKILGDDYPWKTLSMSKLSPLRYYGRYCTDFVAWRLNEQAGTTDGNYRWKWGNLTPSGGNAYKWASYWPSKTNTKPALGAVAWWKAGHPTALGHVAIVSAIYADGSILVEEYNWTNRGAYDTRRVAPGNKYYPDAFIHIQDWR